MKLFHLPENINGLAQLFTILYVIPMKQKVAYSNGLTHTNNANWQFLHFSMRILLIFLPTSCTDFRISHTHAHSGDIIACSRSETSNAAGFACVTSCCFCIGFPFCIHLFSLGVAQWSAAHLGTSCIRPSPLASWGRFSGYHTDTNLPLVGRAFVRQRFTQEKWCLFCWDLFFRCCPFFFSRQRGSFPYQILFLI